MNEVSFLRHAGWVSPEDLVDPITIVGCGAVGSNLAITAAKMGFHNFVLWDADLVESHNLPNQAYDLAHVGMKKVDALEDVLTRFNPKINVTKNADFLTKENSSQVNGLMVIATDTMKSRYEFHDIIKWNTKIVGAFECRLGFDYGEVNYINPLDPSSCKNFQSGLRPDSDIPEGPCNLRICTTLVQLVSSYAVHSICARYAAKRDGSHWDVQPKTIFNLSPTLNVFAPGLIGQ
jgi:molybdopterin/thiamine biosynthesis adenylyltransferase